MPTRTWKEFIDKQIMKKPEIGIAIIENHEAEIKKLTTWINIQDQSPAVGQLILIEHIHEESKSMEHFESSPYFWLMESIGNKRPDGIYAGSLRGEFDGTHWESGMDEGSYPNWFYEIGDEDCEYPLNPNRWKPITKPEVKECQLKK